MYVHRNTHARHFTVLPNALLRDRRLSFTARGILGHLLSLPDGAHEDVRTLADRNPGVGRRGVAKALDELVAHGYYVRRLVRDRVTGQVHTETHVGDVPGAFGGAAAVRGPGASGPDPVPVPPGSGELRDGRAGASPMGVKTAGKPPSLPAVAARRGADEAATVTGPAKLTGLAPAAEPASAADDAGPPPADAAGRPDETTRADLGDGPLARAAALLARLVRHEPKLALSAAETLALAPLAAPWLDRELSELETRALLTSGLPPVVHSARAILADRLTRKLPAVRPAAPTTSFAECADCGHPLPPPQSTGICGTCAGVAAPAPPAPLPAEEARALAREALRPRRRPRPRFLPA